MGSGRVVVLKYSIGYFQVSIYSMVFLVILGIIFDISGYQNIGSTRNTR